MVDRLMNALRPNPIAGFDQDAYGPGLQAPALDPIMLASSAAAPALEEALSSAPRMMASEAGALFPEGMGIPKDKSLIKEFSDTIPESRKNYLRNQQLYDFHAENQDWPRVLQDKWAMLKNQGGN